MRDKHMPSLSREDISIIYAEHEKVKAGRRFGPVIRSVYILECCTGGAGSVIINGKEFPVSAGQCYMLLPGDTVIHTSDTQSPREGYWCALDGISIKGHVEYAGITSQSPFIAPSLFGPIRDLMERLTQIWPCRDAGAPLRQTACAYGLLGLMLQNKPATQRDSLIDMAIGLMQTNYPNPLTVATIAAQVGLERSYFSEQFKKKTGLSPYQYLTQLRIQKACQLLSQGHSITDTSYLVGLEPHNFGRVFKKEVGIAPRNYVSKLRTSSGNVSARSVRIE